MTKFTHSKKATTRNFYVRMASLKDDYKIKENMYSDSLCRLIKEVSRELNRSETEEGLFEAKRKTLELSLVATE